MTLSLVPPNIRIRVALVLRNIAYAQALESLFPIPRQEELFIHSLLPWTWEEVLYGTPTYEPQFCLCCYSKLGHCIGGKVTLSCHHCQGKTELHAFGVSEARAKHNYLEYSTGYCHELIDLLIGESSRWTRL